MSDDHGDSDSSLNNSLNASQLKNGTFDSTNTCVLQVNNGHSPRQGEYSSSTKESKIKRKWSKSNANSDDSDGSSLNNSMTTALAGLLCHSRSSSGFLSLQANHSNSTLDVTSLSTPSNDDEFGGCYHSEATVNQDVDCVEHTKPKLFKFSPNQSEIFEAIESDKCNGIDKRAAEDLHQLNSSQKPNTNGVNGSSAQRKLVLHFDIRNTILVADSVTNVTIEQALNTFLTGVTWGTDDKEWRWCSDHPSLTPPQNHPDGAMTYYKRLEKVLVRIPSDRALLRQATGDFTSMPIGSKFRPYFERHLKLLEWTYENSPQCDLKSVDANLTEAVSLKESLDPMLTISGADGRPYHYILPSFLHMIYALQAAGRDFSVVLRTFGMDASNVLAATKRCIDGHHPGYRRPLPIKVYDIPGHIHRSRDGQISLDEPRDSSLNTSSDSRSVMQNNTKSLSTTSNAESLTPVPSILTTTSSYDTERQIYEQISLSTGISGYVDDFRYWQNDGYNHRSGKPLWIDLSDKSVHHIFFDDNIRVKDADSIVDVRVFEDSASSCRSLSLDEIIKFENVCMVQADLLDSTGNAEYFLEKIKMCEANYDVMIKHEYKGIFQETVSSPDS